MNEKKKEATTTTTSQQTIAQLRFSIYVLPIISA
jgi:hypothetical protein